MKRKVLVVDDERTARLTLEAILRKEGYEVLLAADGEEALEKIKSEFIDVALVDLVMPGKDGISVLEEIKKISPDTQVIMITGFGTIESAVKAVKKGAADYIPKPFKKGEIQTVIERVLEEFRFEKSTEDPFEIFNEIISQGTPGLCISTKESQDIPNTYGVKCLHLSNLEDIRTHVIEFLNENRNAVVLIDGIEKLLTKYPVKKVNDLVVEFNKKFSSSNSKLILSYDPSRVEGSILDEFTRAISGPYTELVSEILSNPLRREIIRLLSQRKKAIFTTIKLELGITDPPNLSFHLRKLKSAGIVDRDKEKRYFLTNRGKTLNNILKSLDKEGFKEMHNIIWISKS